MSASLLCLALLLGEVPGAHVYGTVRDSETGTPVEGAAIELLAGNRRSITDEAGRYRLESVTAGPRHMKVAGLGYRSRTLHVFVPAKGAVRIDVALVPQPIPLLPVEASVAGGSVTSRKREPGDRVRRVGTKTLTYYDVATNPGLAEPDFLEALAGGSVRVAPESPSGVHVRGGSSSQNLFLLDGIPIFSPYHVAGPFSAVPADAISRVDVHAGVAPTVWDGALSGVIGLWTRRPNPKRIETRGAVTPSAVSLTVEGPAGLGGGLMLSGGWGRPGSLAPSGESSYVHGTMAHVLVKGEWPLADGRAWIIGFQNGNRLRMPSVPTEAGRAVGAPAGTGEAQPKGEARLNRFTWNAGSYGVGWERPVGGRAILEARVWYAELNVSADWWAVDGPLAVSGRRGSSGSRLQLTLDGGAARSFFGLDLEQERTAYAVSPLESPIAGKDTVDLELRARPTMVGAFVEHHRILAGSVQLAVGLRGNLISNRGAHLSPRLSAHWIISPRLSASAGYARTHQWVQSLRNSESPIDKLFSPDLPVGVGTVGMPVAKADQFTVAVTGEAAVGVHVVLEAYTRALDGVVMVAPGTGQPFAVDGFSVGSAETWGVGLSLDVERARYRATGSYGFGSVGHEVRDEEYRPGFAVGHRIAAAIAYYPSAKLELRSAVRAEISRPATLTEGPFVWEACNILEMGCEVEGTPQRRSGPLGGARLPAYVRLDLGIRKHWHSRILERDGEIAVFATLSNVLGRTNVLGYVSDPQTGEVSKLPMRPFSPLTAGLEWRF